MPQKKQKRRRLGSSLGGILRRKAEYKNHVWSVDFIFDRTTNGRSLKTLVVIDEHTRECLALEVGRRFTSDQFIELLADLIAGRGVPKFIRSDNGPEFISRGVRQFLRNIDVGTSSIEPGSPWQNGYVESFNSRFRDECLAGEEFTTVAEARAVIERWRHTYNHRRPHGSLGGLTPSEFAKRCAGRVGTGDCSPAPLTEPDLWAHIRLLKLISLEQHKLSLDLRGGLEVLPPSTQ